MDGFDGGRAVPQLGAIADDFTGATDLATNLVSRGFRTVVTIGVPAVPTLSPEADAVVVALRTRTASKEAAVTQSLQAYGTLHALGVRQVYLKYCSTFDSTPGGNIGPVADALVDATSARGAVVVPAFPANRRTVYQGVLFADGKPLAEGSMAMHPLTPMTDSDVTRLLAPQTRHRVGLVRHEVVRRGPAAVRSALDAEHVRGCVLVVVDAIDDGDLRTIAAATAAHPLVTGGSGLALGMTPPDSAHERDPRRLPVVPDSPRVVLVGSMSAASRRQVAHARRTMPSQQLDPSSARTRPDEVVEELVRWVQDQWAQSPNQPVLVHSADGGTRAAGSRDDGRPATDKALADAVESVFAALAPRLAALGARRFVVGGGETSGRVTSALGVSTLTVGPQIAPGVAWAHGRLDARPADPGHLLALKSGNFGADDLLTTAWDAIA